MPADLTTKKIIITALFAQRWEDKVSVMAIVSDGEKLDWRKA